MTSFLDTVDQTIETHRLLKRGSRVLAAVSGGPDSLALWAALVALREKRGLHLDAAYVDHGLRPQGARREAAHVQRMGRLWGVGVHRLRVRLRRKRGESLEVAARRLRYEALIGLAKRIHAQAIAVGHTQDDQAETVLMWLLRGTGTTGLAGIPPVRKASGRRVIRPLLDCSRREVEAFLKAQGISWCRDSSNRSGRFFRNRIRKELIPYLEAHFSPRLRPHLGNLAKILREDLGWMEQLVLAEFKRSAKVKRNQIRLNRLRLRQAPVALRRGLLRTAIRRLQGDTAGFSARHWMALDRLLMNGALGDQDLPHRVRVSLEGRWLLLKKSGTLKSGESISPLRSR